MGRALIGMGSPAGAAPTSNTPTSLVGGSVASGNAGTNYNYPMPFAGAFSGLTASGALSGTWSLTAQKNGAAATQTISNSAPADSTHSDTYAIGDTIAGLWGTTTGPTVTRVQVVFQGTVQHATIYAACQTTAGGQFGSPATAWGRFCSIAVNASTEQIGQLQAGVAGTVSGFAIIVAMNSQAAAITGNFRKNGANGNQLLTIGAGLTGTFQDTTHTDALVVGDLFNFQVLSAGTAGFTVMLSGVGFAPTSGAINDLFAGTVAAGLVLAASATYWVPFWGQIIATVTPETAAQIAHSFPVTLSRLRVSIITNTTTAVSTLTLRKAAANANGAVSIGAGLTGWFVDTTHTDALAATDPVNYQLVTGAGGSGLVTGPFAVTEQSSTTYAVSIGEAGAALDTVSSHAVYPNAVSEAGAAGDTVGAKGAFTAAVSESGGAVATQGSTASYPPQAVVESGSAVATQGSTASYPLQAVVESGAASDTTTLAGLRVPGLIAEAGAAADHTDSVAAFPVQVVSEAGAAVDAVSEGTASVGVVSEQGTAVDTVNAAGHPFVVAMVEAGLAVDIVHSLAIYPPEVIAEAGAALDLTDVASTSQQDSVAEAGAAIDLTDAQLVLVADVSESGSAVDVVIAQAMQLSVIVEEAGSAEEIADNVALLVAAVEEAGAALDASTAGAVMDVLTHEVGAAIEQTDAQVFENYRQLISMMIRIARK